MPPCTLYRWTDVESEAMTPLITRQYLTGSHTTLARISLNKGAAVQRHQHHNEQITHVVAGALEFRLDEGPVIVRAGEILCIPPDAPHEVVALEDTVALDIFNPPRQDWINGNDSYLRS
jgi:quercetin dioxygenase-like cupin family protein